MAVSSIGSPFAADGMYTGSIQAAIIKDEKTEMVWVEVDGSRILLRPFQGKYESDFKSRFQPVITSDQEFDGLVDVFQKSVNSEYGSGTAKTNEEIRNLIERDSSRAYAGNPFTGYAIIDKETKECIGRISIGNCFDWKKGDAQSGLILSQKHRESMKGPEAVVLLAGLISILTRNHQFKVGGKDGESPLKRVTATTLDANQSIKNLFEKYQMQYDRPLTEKENYSKEARSLYAVNAAQVETVLRKSLADPEKQLQLIGVKMIS